MRLWQLAREEGSVDASSHKVWPPLVMLGTPPSLLCHVATQVAGRCGFHANLRPKAGHSL